MCSWARGLCLLRARCTNLKKSFAPSDPIEEALHLQCDGASERARRGEEAFNQVFLGEGGKGERVTCASPHHTTCSSQSLCLSVQSRGHICHLLLKKNEMSLFPIFPRGPFIPIFAPSFRNSFRRKEEGKGSKKEGRGRRRGIGRRRSGSWSDIAWKSSFF